MQHPKSVLRFFNLLDSANRLSLTNVAVYVVLVKLCFMPTIGLTEAAAFLVAMLNYSHKRSTTAKYEANAANQNATAGVKQ